MNVLEHMISFLAPHACIRCGREGLLLCPPCYTTLRQYPARCYRCTNPAGMCRTCSSCRQKTPLEYVWASTRYADDAKTLVHLLKFERAGAAATVIGDIMARSVQSGDVRVVTHVPTAPQRVRQRGYDQAERIARRVAQRIGVPYAPLLARQGVQRQVGQSQRVRRQQMADAFRVRPAVEVHNDGVLLIDDVITTGSTLEAAAIALRQAGVGHIAAAVFAAT